MRFFGGHSWRFEAGVFLALLVGAAFAPQTHAGCGEPSFVAWPTAEASHDAEVGSLNAALYSLPHHSIPGPRPCTGPHCSQAPLAPPAAPMTAAASSQEWACLPVISDAVDSQGIAYRLEDDLPMPIFRALSIYHPPR